MNEPDRPRQDVSIEEAERMPMTEGELTALEVTIRESFYVVYEELTEPLLALVAEVRRLRDACLTLADELDGEGDSPWSGSGEEPAYYHGLSDAASDLRQVVKP